MRPDWKQGKRDDVRESLRVGNTVLVVATEDTIIGSVRRYIAQAYAIHLEDCDLHYSFHEIENSLMIFTCDVKDPEE